MALEAHIQELDQKHRALDEQILKELSRPNKNEMLLNQLKREKLSIKDRIFRLRAGKSVN